VFLAAAAAAPGAHAQGLPARSEAQNATTAARAALPPAAAAGRGYVIGADDVLGITFWRDKDLSGDVVVRPDGKIALPLINEVQAAGLTPDELRDVIVREAKRYMEEPNATVIVRQINSRKVYITGQVEKPGVFMLTSTTTVAQLIALAGGLKEFAKSKEIVVVRNEGGRPVAYPFNYQELLKRKRLAQNIELRPGDTVIVP
jgi:polysaccharide export outer membrane protein